MPYRTPSLLPPPKGIRLPTSLLNTRNLPLQRIYPELKLKLTLASILLATFSLCHLHHQQEFGHELTLAMRTSLKTPFPFPPIIHLFTICDGRV